MSSANSKAAGAEAIAVTAGEARLAGVIHRPGGPPVGTNVIFCHGFRGSKEGGGRATALAEQVAALGHTVLRFDFTPAQCLSRQIEELAAVVRYCRATIGGRIVLFGRSMGGSASLVFAAGDRNVDGLCLWATPHDLAETFRLSLGSGYDRLTAGEELTIEDEFGRLELTPAFLDDFSRQDLLACARSLHGVPILVVHGRDDEVVPLRQAQELYRQAGQPKELVVIPGGDHRFLYGHPPAAAALLDWLARRLAGPGI